LAQRHENVLMVVADHSKVAKVSTDSSQLFSSSLKKPPRAVTWWEIRSPAFGPFFAFAQIPKLISFSTLILHCTALRRFRLRQELRHHQAGKLPNSTLSNDPNELDYWSSAAGPLIQYPLETLPD